MNGKPRDHADDGDALFADGDGPFKIAVRRSDAREFFQRRDPTGRLLAERADWLARYPSRHLALEPRGEAVFDEFGQWLRGWSGASPHNLADLARRWEPDVLFLAPDEASELRLAGGALVFPTSWALEEKLGHTMREIHAPVPGLNAALGPRIDRLLARLPIGSAWYRANWGLAATAELNLHPALNRPAPELPLRLDRLWLRVEQQALLAMPRSRGVVFGIRIELRRLDGLLDDGQMAAGLSRALRTMPDDLANYKRVRAVRNALIEALSAASCEPRIIESRRQVGSRD